MASANGVNGWTGAPATDVVPVKYQDNAAQTNFWADFIASGNTLGAQAEHLVATGNACEINTFIHTLQGFEQNVSNFDAAQGGIFQARFDNELLGNDSTVGADVAAMIKGLRDSTTPHWSRRPRTGFTPMPLTSVATMFRSTAVPSMLTARRWPKRSIRRRHRCRPRRSHR